MNSRVCADPAAFYPVVSEDWQICSAGGAATFCAKQHLAQVGCPSWADGGASINVVQEPHHKVYGGVQADLRC